ncbi:hypothetical protein IFR05_000677 [Cadophora sp. M221]|nr:hypothetical protein IFR05_000677 [Cadophora sp. M221]
MANWLTDYDLLESPMAHCLPALRLLKSAYDRGINTWDTANVYSNGESERIIGRALKIYNITRNKVVIMTKCYRPMADDGEPSSIVAMLGKQACKSKDYVNQFGEETTSSNQCWENLLKFNAGSSRKAIFASVEESLERLGTKYIDLLQLHRYDDTVSPEETMRALHDLVTCGKVHYIGASSMWAYQLATLQYTAERNSWTKLISMQNHYNLLYREEEREMNKYCKLAGIGLIPWSPLATGHLARPPSEFGLTKRSSADTQGARFPTGQSRDDQEIIRRVQVLASRRNWSMSNVALAWINRRVTSPIIGFSSDVRMDEALAARGKTLTEEEERYLEEPYEPKAIQGHE